MGWMIGMGLWISMQLLVVVLLLRLMAVVSYRADLLVAVARLVRRDYFSGREWEWRYDELDVVPFDRMLWTWWRPLTSFYPRSPARPER